MRRQPGDVVHEFSDGRIIRYSPSQGSSTRYVVSCSHGKFYSARTVKDAYETAADMRRGDCAECAR